MTATVTGRTKRRMEEQKKADRTAGAMETKGISRTAKETTKKIRENDRFKKKLMIRINFRKKYTIYYIEKKALVLPAIQNLQAEKGMEDIYGNEWY